MRESLKDCPFCGCDAIASEWSVACSWCPAQVSHEERYKARDLWNRRVTDDATIESLAGKALNEIETSIQRAQHMLSDLCRGRQRWTMSIPARPTDDPDLVIGDALRSADWLLSLVRLALVDIAERKLADSAK